MSIELRGSPYFQWQVPLGSRVMNPNENHRMMLYFRSQNSMSGGVEFLVELEVDGIRRPILSKSFSLDELADEYELVHHQVHGYDPRGLDPREGPTRLRPR